MAHGSIWAATKIVESSPAVRFTIVGALGFGVNLLVLYLLHGRAHINLVFAQLIAAEMALISNFIFHNSWTYRNYLRQKLINRLGMFHLTSWSGVFLTTTLLVLFVEVLHANYIVGLILSGAIVAFWNYLWTRYVVWRRKHLLVESSAILAKD